MRIFFIVLGSGKKALTQLCRFVYSTGVSAVMMMPQGYQYISKRQPNFSKVNLTQSAYFYFDRTAEPISYFQKLN